MSTEPQGPGRSDASWYMLPRRRRPVLGSLWWVTFSMITIAIAGYLFYQSTGNYVLNVGHQTQETKEAELVTAPEPKNLPDHPINVLILGSDSRGEEGGRSDSMILLRLDFKRQFISQLSFPRDLYVDIPGYGKNKINAAYSFGKTKLTIETLNQLVGEKVTYFFNVDFEAFRKLVNKAGGVYIDVDRYYFNDNSQGDKYEPINIKPGYQRLSGFDALDYVRFRHTDSDFSRIARQQNLLAELKRTNRSLAGVNHILDVVHSDVQTNLKSVSRLRTFLDFGMSIEKDRIGKFSVPVSGTAMDPRAGSIDILDTDKLPAVLDAWKNPEFKSDVNNSYTTDPTKLTVLVYNGSSRPGLARQVGTRIEKMGYTVLLGNSAPNGTYPTTAVFYGPNKRQDAKALSTWFGPTASIGERQAGMDTEPDLTVIVGDNYAGLKKTWGTATSPGGTAGSTNIGPGVRQTADTIATSALKSRIQTLRRTSGHNYLVPTHLPAGSEVVYVRSYNIKTADRGRPDALAMVLRLPGSSQLGGNRYAMIMQTTMKNPPIITTATGQKGGFYTFYDGKIMQRLLWRKGDMTYWITNSLDGTLSDVTMRDMAKFMVAPTRVNAAVGKRGVSVNVSDESRTP